MATSRDTEHLLADSFGDADVVRLEPTKIQPKMVPEMAARAEDMDAYVTKPIRFGALVEALWKADARTEV